MAWDTPEISFVSLKRPLLIISALSLFINISLTISHGIPAPSIHDEFGYLLTADTFASGRITNPTHPFKEHFESHHIFWEPTYQARYPPAQGFFLALGQVFTSLPIVGVWLSFALGCCALFWMMRSIVDEKWALLVTLLVLTNPTLIEYWGNTYWGGAVAMLGGSLFFGALFRLLKDISLQNSIIYGLGLFILANSRPAEGLFVVVGTIPILLYIFFRDSNYKRVTTYRNFIVPIASISLLLIAWILFYNYRLTGDMLRWYYLQSTYDPGFHSPTVTYSFRIIRFWIFFIGPILSISILGLVVGLFHRIQSDWPILFAVILSLLLVHLSAAITAGWPHYIAPITCIIFSSVAYGLSRFDDFKIKGESLGKISSAIVALVLVLQIIGLVDKLLSEEPYTWNKYRQDVISDLKKKEGKDLVFVHYSPNHNPHQDWVYNKADIDHAEVIWARDLGREKNSRLVEYYKDRNVWGVLPDLNPPKLQRLKTITTDLLSQ